MKRIILLLGLLAAALSLFVVSASATLPPGPTNYGVVTYVDKTHFQVAITQTNWSATGWGGWSCMAADYGSPEPVYYVNGVSALTGYTVESFSVAAEDGSSATTIGTFGSFLTQAIAPGTSNPGHPAPYPDGEYGVAVQNQSAANTWFTISMLCAAPAAEPVLAHHYTGKDHSRCSEAQKNPGAVHYADDAAWKADGPDNGEWIAGGCPVS